MGVVCINTWKGVEKMHAACRCRCYLVNGSARLWTIMRPRMLGTCQASNKEPYDETTENETTFGEKVTKYFNFDEGKLSLHQFWCMY